MRKKKIKIDAFKQILDIVQKSSEAKREKDQVFCYALWFQQDGNHRTIQDIIDHPCGTVACIGGWGAILQAAKSKKTRTSKYGISEAYDEANANKFFGITDEEGDYLYYGYWHEQSLNASDAHVIKKLKNIIRTGRIINPAFDNKKGYQ